MRTNDKNVNEISETETHISENVKNAVNDYMQKNKNELIKLCEEYKTDVLQINNRLYQLKNKEWKTLVTDEEKQNNFINNAQVNLKLDIETKL